MAESQNIEYKESWRDEYLRWVCGFANARGGCIYIGMNDDGKVVGITDCKKLLEKLGLITDGKLKRAAVLLFYRNPHQLFTGCYVKIGKFGVGSDLQYQDVIEGSLILTADRVIDLIYLKYLKAAITYEKDVRVETYPFAREAVREAVYNALIHCKWEDGIPIQIRIEDRNMYISNACVFPSDWTTENLMQIHNSRPYNPDLAGTFYRAGYIEAWGRGIQKICEACEKMGAPMPEYTLLGDDLTVKFSVCDSAGISDSKTPKRQNGGLEGGLADRIIMIISSDRTVTIARISDILNIPKRTVEREIKNLRESGRITRKGGRRYGYWEIM